ncbi:hypothetical protein OS493_012597 [Desmophyllum pertusum]|uniref:Ion transport domain-containing protein n=1 Tax=Desmophyllum pertusum TaxID=174260 RepID=A0A9W9ZDS2_9CNID|nr:hypothetical protein OS493_012597 [Desmophyllum pertusum]
MKGPFHSIKDTPKHCGSDRWNRLDFLCLLVYLVVLTLRVATPFLSRSVRNNRALAIASYFYGFNALCLTFRIVGQIMEQSKEMGIIQIALFSILKDIRAIIWQFMAAILAFSIAITKVYMAEESFLANGSDGSDNACKKSGISCWWAMITQLVWALLGESKEFDHMTSEDLPSKTVARIFYAGFLIMGIILLLNLLIALLTNTYQRVQDNSTFEWSFKRLVTCQTYDAYDPIPVPMNIIYSIGKLLRSAIIIIKKRRREEEEEKTACINSIFVSTIGCEEIFSGKRLSRIDGELLGGK